MAAIATIATAAAMAYPIIESFIHEHNSKKASQLRKQLDQVLSRFNLKIDNLRKELEQKGIKYNQLMEKLAYVSPSGKGAKLRSEAEKQYRKDVDTINTTIANVTDKMNQYSALANKEIADKESKGIVRTILNQN